MSVAQYYPNFAGNLAYLFALFLVFSATGGWRYIADLLLQKASRPGAFWGTRFASMLRSVSLNKYCSEN
jgi:hypothetical protein